MAYSYKTVGPNGKTQGANFFSFMGIKFGNDFQSWRKHPDFDNALDTAHVEIFGETGKARGGLKLRTEFLVHAVTQPKSTKIKRQCYNDASLDALEAGIIDMNQYKKMVA